MQTNTNRNMQTINIGHENKKDLNLIKLSDFIVGYFICWSEVNSPLGDRILSLCYRTPCDNIWAELANSRSSPILAPCLRSPLMWALWPRDCQKFILYLWFFYRIYMLFYHCFIQGNLLASKIDFKTRQRCFDGNFHREDLSQGSTHQSHSHTQQHSIA